MKKLYIFIGIGIVIITGTVIFFNKAGQPTFKEENETPQESFNVAEKEKITLIIDNGQEAPNNFEIEFEKGITAFDLLKNKTEELNLALETKFFDMGVMVEKIGSKKNGQDGKYWLYYVNEEMPMVSADKKELKPGDKVEFKFEKSPF